MWTLLGILPVLIWLYLLLGRGAFWRASELRTRTLSRRLRPPPEPLKSWR